MISKYIGLPLKKVKAELEKNGEQVVVINNNFNIDGDTTLITNVKRQNDKVVLVVGEFIFNLKRKQNDTTET